MEVRLLAALINLFSAEMIILQPISEQSVCLPWESSESDSALIGLSQTSTLQIIGLSNRTRAVFSHGLDTLISPAFGLDLARRPRCPKIMHDTGTLRQLHMQTDVPHCSFMMHAWFSHVNLPCNPTISVISFFFMLVYVKAKDVYSYIISLQPSLFLLLFHRIAPLIISHSVRLTIDIPSYHGHNKNDRVDCPLCDSSRDLCSLYRITRSGHNIRSLTFLYQKPTEVGDGYWWLADATSSGLRSLLLHIMCHLWWKTTI